MKTLVFATSHRFGQYWADFFFDPWNNYLVQKPCPRETLEWGWVDDFLPHLHFWTDPLSPRSVVSSSSIDRRSPIYSRAEKVSTSRQQRKVSPGQSLLPGKPLPNTQPSKFLMLHSRRCWFRTASSISTVPFTSLCLHLHIRRVCFPPSNFSWDQMPQGCH